jgi:alkaline phosphatase
MHRHRPKSIGHNPRLAEINPEEYESVFWEERGRKLLEQHLKVYNAGVAKNVILFLGDGMSIATLAAARTHKGQLMNKTGEETELFFETFPVTGLSKVFSYLYY